MKFPLLVVLLASLVLAIAIPHTTAFGLNEAPFGFPPTLYAALIGVVSSLVLVPGLKDRFPQIAGALAVLVTAVVTTALDLLAGVITTGVPVAFWPIITQAALILVSWLAAYGTFRTVKKFQIALAGNQI